MHSSMSFGAAATFGAQRSSVVARVLAVSAALALAGCGGSGSGATIPLDPPAALSYAPVQFDLARDVMVPPLRPTYSGGAATFSITPALPSGMSINRTTGVVSGLPETALARTTFTVRAQNAQGSVTAALELEIHDAFDAPKFVYALHADRNEISCWKHDASANVLVPIGRVTTGSLPIRVEADPLGRFLYVALGGQEHIAVHAIDQRTGMLEPVELFPADGATFDLCFDPSGRFLFKSNLHVSTVQSFRVDAQTGYLVPNGSSVHVPGPSGLTISRDGRELFAGSIDGDAVLHFRVDQATGAIENLVGAVGAGTPVDVLYDDATQRLYVLDFLGNRLLTYFVDPNLDQPVLLFDTPTPGGPGSIVKNGNELNVACHSDPLVQRYKLDGPGGQPVPYDGVQLIGRPTKIALLAEGYDAIVALDDTALIAQIEQAVGGDLTFVDRRPCESTITDVTVVRGPVESQLTTTGLFTATSQSLELSGFRVEEQGLVPAGLPVNVGLDPQALVVDTLGSRLFVVERGSDRISSFAVDATTLVATPTASTLAGLAPKDAAIVPGGQHLVSIDADRVALWDVAADGALELAAQESIGSMPRHVAVDPSGRFAYVTAGEDVLVFAIDARAGTLTALPTSGLTFAANSTPSGLAIAPFGTALVVALEGSLRIHVAELDPVDGSLTSKSTVNTGRLSVDPTFDATGARLFTVEPNDDSMTLYALDANHVLTLLSRADCGQQSSGVAVDRNGERVFGSAQGSDSIEVLGLTSDATVLQPGASVGVGSGSAPQVVASFAAWGTRP
jgi:6-phosphogluconolactonase (cycloisomerase 2 family)